jgi:hypothetical protein
MEMWMTYRITLADSVYYTVQGLADAQSEALDHARELTRVCGFPVTVTVHRMGHPARDGLGRDVTKAAPVGSAVGRIENKMAFVGWQAAPLRPRVSADGGRSAAEAVAA